MSAGELPGRASKVLGRRGVLGKPNLPAAVQRPPRRDRVPGKALRMRLAKPWRLLPLILSSQEVHASGARTDQGYDIGRSQDFIFGLTACL